PRTPRRSAAPLPAPKRAKRAAAPTRRSARRRPSVRNDGSLTSSSGEIAENQVRDHGTAPADIAFRPHLALENAAERVLVGDVEHAERGDRLVDLHRVDAGAKQPVRLAALDHAREPVDDRSVERAHRLRLAEMPPPGLVLGHYDA